MLATQRLARGTFLSVVLALGACDGSDDGGEMDSAADDSSPSSVCADEARADAFTVDLSKTDAGATVTIVDAEPAEPTRGDNNWTVRLTDASGMPMEGVTVGVKPWMPDHGHGSPVQAQVTDLGEGEYEIATLNLFMAGLWQVTVDLTDAEGATETVMFSVCVE